MRLAHLLTRRSQICDVRGYYEPQMTSYNLPSYNLGYYIYKRADDRRSEAISDPRLIAIESIRSIFA